MYDRASKLRVTFDDERTIIEQIDRLAANEAVARADMIRRALRQLLLTMPVCPNEVTVTLTSQPVQPTQPTQL
jgi:hypothetical protein